jgi:predicted ribosome quality control (RQC) complex YloA/Tae2 family protein
LNLILEGVNVLTNEFVLKQFDEIEQKVERLIEICNALEATNLEQKNKIKSLEEEIQGKVEAERSYAEEKALIRSKIDGLLVKLDEVSAE